jgi:hypothetical protein
MNTIIEKLEQLLANADVCPSHGIEHAICVMNHAQKALEAITEEITGEITEEITEAILLAALLHDADDRKFFPMNDNYQNLRQMLIV